MRSFILALAAGASLACATVGADAMPAGAIAGASEAPAVTLVSGGCGPYRHRGPYGACVPNGAYYRPAYGYYGPRYYRPYARCGIRVGPIGIGGPC